MLLARLEPQVLVSVKLVGLAPVMVMPEMVMALAPVLLRVTTCAAPLAKVSDVGESEATGTAVAAPVPATTMLCEAVLELSVTVRLAERAPAAVGVKLTVMVQLVLTATLEPQVLVCEKSPGLVPMKAMPDMVSAAVPVLVSVAVCVVAVLAMTVVP